MRPPFQWDTQPHAQPWPRLAPHSPLLPRAAAAPTPSSSPTPSAPSLPSFPPSGCRRPLLANSPFSRVCCCSACAWRVPDSRLNKQAARSGRWLGAPGGGSRNGGLLLKEGKGLWDLGCLGGKSGGKVSLESTENLEENAQYTEGFSQEKVARGPHGGGGTGFLFFFFPSFFSPQLFWRIL